MRLSLTPTDLRCRLSPLLTAHNPRLPPLTFVLALALPLLGCGPIGSAVVISDAEQAVAQAHAADGDKLAIYETTSADLYLQKAREESGRAHYDAASEFAKKSAELAESASQKALAARNSASTPAPQATIKHEAIEVAPAPVVVAAPAKTAPATAPDAGPSAAPAASTAKASSAPTAPAASSPPDAGTPPPAAPARTPIIPSGSKP